MSRNVPSRPRESAKDVLDYLRFAGYELTREQFVRLHRQRLIEKRLHTSEGMRGSKTTYRPGTAERILRIAQLEATTSHLDELAWRLWWEGSPVEPDLVRDYLVKMANRWDDRLGEIRGDAKVSPGEEGVGERDVIDEVFFQHLTLVPSTAAERQRLAKGSKIYVEFAAILTDLLSGDFYISTKPEPSIFDRFSADDFDPGQLSKSARKVYSSALATLQRAAATPYAEVVQSLNAEQIEEARPVAFLLSKMIGSIGAIMHELFGATGPSHVTPATRLVAMSDSPEEQVLSLLLSSSLLAHKRIRKNLPTIKASSVIRPAISFQDYLGLRYLAKEVDGLEKLVTPRRMRNAFESSEGADRWRAVFEEFALVHPQEIEEVIASRPALFGRPPLDYRPSKTKIKKKHKKPAGHSKHSRYARHTR